MKTRRLFCTTIILILIFAAAQRTAFAGVSLKNGNFFMSYTDIAYPGGFEPKMERVYNSKSDYVGIYGWGWGCEHDVYLSVVPGGSIVVHEYGGGAQNTFLPEKFDREGFNAGVGDLAQAAQDTKAVNNPAEIGKYKTRLLTDNSFFMDEWKKYRDKKLVSAPELPLGTIVKSNKFSYQAIKRIRAGYLREFDNGRREQYDNNGRIVRIVDKNGNFISFVYDANSRLQTLIDNFGRKMTFTFNERGFLERIVGKSGETATYRYNDRGELIYSKDVDGNAYEFGYDALRHNMTKIVYSDKTMLEIAYYGLDLKENVKSLKDRDGTLTLYTYGDPNDRSHLSVGVKVKGSDGGLISESAYEYLLAVDDFGIEWTKKLIATLDGDRTETEYNRDGVPIVIIKGADASRFVYDGKGRVTRKETPTEIIELTYDARAAKVSRVVKTAKDSKSLPPSWANFKYDAAGNLIFAENSDGEAISLKYDANGRMDVLTSKDGSRIEFAYNENSKPIEIRQIVGDKTQRIVVTYTAGGEIEKVESPEGRKVAAAVTTAFQNLLDIIRPAGVNLSF